MKTLSLTNQKMANVKVFAYKQTDAWTNGHAKNNMPPIYQRGGLKMSSFITVIINFQTLLLKVSVTLTFDMKIHYRSHMHTTTLLHYGSFSFTSVVGSKRRPSSLGILVT